MIISNKYKFIFIKTKKTAGTSIEVYLSKFCSSNDILTPINPPIEPHVARNYKGYWNPLYDIIDQKRGSSQSVLKIYRKTIRKLKKRKKFYNHIPARTLKKRVSKRIWNNYYKFCVERNPWEKTLSDYSMRRDRTNGSLTLNQYFKLGKFCRNIPLYTDNNGKVIVDRIIRYESLSNGLQDVFHSLNIPFNGELGTHAKSNHRLNRTPYQDIFTTTQKKVIESVFADEIAMHCYKF